MLRIATLVAAFAFAAPAFAECWHLEDEPSWTLTKTGEGFTWKQAGRTVELVETSAGTGVMSRVLFPAEGGDGYRFIHHAGDIILEMEVYKKGCE